MLYFENVTAGMINQISTTTCNGKKMNYKYLEYLKAGAHNYIIF
jgi:hypothetical protein